MPQDQANSKPRERMSAYAYFVQACREEKNPRDVKIMDFYKKCSERWKALSKKEKQRFARKSRKDKRRYENEMQGTTTPEIKKVKKCKPRVKDRNAPKRVKSVFVWFSSVERPNIKAEHPEYTSAEILKEIRRRWSSADSATKSKYISLFERDKKRYEKEMKKYRTVLEKKQTQPGTYEVQVEIDYEKE